MKELMALAAGLPINFQDREDVAAGGLAGSATNATPPGNEAALYGWTGRRAGRGARLLTGDPLRITEGGRYA